MIFVWEKNRKISAFFSICTNTMTLALILQVLSNSIHRIVCNTSQPDFSHMWWLQKVDLIQDFFGAFFNLCGLKLRVSEIYLSLRSPLAYLSIALTLVSPTYENTEFDHNLFNLVLL